MSQNVRVRGIPFLGAVNTHNLHRCLTAYRAMTIKILVVNQEGIPIITFMSDVPRSIHLCSTGIARLTQSMIEFGLRTVTAVGELGIARVLPWAGTIPIPA